MEAKTAGLDIMNHFKGIVANRHAYAREWKQRTGGKVAGYLCAYVPEEVLYAAGILPVRVLGAQQVQDVTDSFISTTFCAYCRDTLGQGLLGNYDYLSGIVLSHVCTHIRQTFETWRQQIPTEFSHMLWTPTQPESEHAQVFFLQQAQTFREAVEAWLGRKITDEALRSAAETYDHNRRLLRQVYELRKETQPRISGLQAMEAVIASTIMDKSEHSKMLEALLAGAGPRHAGVRLMLIGSENNDTELVGFLEDQGAVIVIEDNCLGNRYFWNETTGDGDPLTAIARRYMDKLPCPMMDLGSRRRSQYLLELAREYRVEGVIFLRQKFCDSHGWEQPIFEPLFEQAGLPSLYLELDVTVPVGQYLTRMQAFMELFL